MNEMWKPIPGYEGLYEVSDHGTVRSLDRQLPWNGTSRFFSGRILSPVATDFGHLVVGLYKDGKSSHARVHRLVMLAFVGLCPEGEEVCHYDGDPANNRLSNLRYDTRSGNFLDSVRHGTHRNTRKTHCPRGHEYTAANTRMEQGRRRCRTCRLEHQRRMDARRALRNRSGVAS